MRLKFFVSASASLASALALACALASCAPADSKAKHKTIPFGTDRACSYYYFLAGRGAELNLEFNEALAAYEKAVICDPDASYAQSKIPLLLVRLERVKEAAVWLHSYLLKHPDDVQQRLLYATILLGQGQTETALRQYHRILASHPDDPGITLPLAELYLASGHPREAQRILEHAIGKDPDSAQAHLLMARLHKGAGRPDDAKASYQRALELNWTAETQIEAAELAAQQGNPKEAEALYRDIIEREEDSEDAYVGLIRLLVRQGREEDAFTELQNLHQVPDKPAWVDLAIARYQIGHGQEKEGRRLLEQIIKLQNSNEARYLLAVLLRQEKKYEEAMRQARLIDEKAPEYADALTMRVDLSIRLNRADDAVLFLERNIAGELSRHPIMYPLLARLHRDAGRTQMARRVLEDGIALYPENEELLYAFGLDQERRGEHAQALATMEKLVALNPDHAAALNFVGYSWANSNINLEKALDYIGRAHKLRPDDGSIEDSLGWVYFRQGRLDEAEKTLEQAREKLDDTEILEHLAEVYLKNGKRDQALALYREILGRLSGAKNDNNEIKTIRNRVEERVRELESGKTEP